MGGRGKAGGVKLASSRGGGRSARRGASSAWTSRASPSGACSSRRPPTSCGSSTSRPCSTASPGASCSWARRRAAWTSRALAAEDPAAIVRVHAHPHLGLQPYQARRMAFALGLGDHLAEAVAICQGPRRGHGRRTMPTSSRSTRSRSCASAARRADVERLALLDAKITLDDSALSAALRATRPCATSTRRILSTSRHVRPA